MFSDNGWANDTGAGDIVQALAGGRYVDLSSELGGLQHTGRQSSKATPMSAVAGWLTALN